MPAAALSRTEFEVVWTSLGLGAVPFPLGAGTDPYFLPGPGGVFAGLAERGLAAGDRLDDEWADCLTVLAYPERSVDAIGRVGPRLAALAASAHGTGALAVLDGDSVVLAPIRVGSLVESVVALLPVLPAGPGHELTVPVDAARQYLASEDAWGTDRWVLGEAGIGFADATLLVNLAEGRRRGGEFGVNVADPHTGSLSRGIPVVSWFDTAGGRYLMTNDGSTLTIAPADAAQIALRLHEVLDGHPHR
jgi:hypothetical protein